jgi:hypothetical protein
VAVVGGGSDNRNIDMKTTTDPCGTLTGALQKPPCLRSYFHLLATPHKPPRHISYFSLQATLKNPPCYTSQLTATPHKTPCPISHLPATPHKPPCHIPYFPLTATPHKPPCPIHCRTISCISTVPFSQSEVLGSLPCVCSTQSYFCNSTVQLCSRVYVHRHQPGGGDVADWMSLLAYELCLVVLLCQKLGLKSVCVYCTKPA